MYKRQVLDGELRRERALVGRDRLLADLGVTITPPRDAPPLAVLLRAGTELVEVDPEPRGRRDGDPQQLTCLLYTSPSPRDRTRARMPSSARKKKKKHL